MTRNVLLAALLLKAILLQTAPALGPHEIAVLVNQNSPRSITLANHYAALRNIPPSNIIHLDLPPEGLRALYSISPEDYTRLIYQPAQQAIQSRALQTHILAWAYSLDFPLLVTAPEPVSLTGITFTRGQLPSTNEIRGGLYPSPLFRGPDRADGPAAPTLSLEQFTLAIPQDTMPIPAMVLGHAGTRGSPLPTILNQLQRSRSADATRPSGNVYFHQAPGDPRHEARAWQFEPVIRELRELGVPATQSTRLPRTDQPLVGIMMGQAWVDPATSGSLVPGALADHLTSFAAVFSSWEQTKLTAWLDAGAAAAAGTIAEPFANWMKFPNARLFAHYAAGATALEAYAQAVRSPLQLLLVGDPLAAPWASPPAVTLIHLNQNTPNTPLTGEAQFMASSWAGLGLSPPTFIFLLNGRVIHHPGNIPQINIDTRQLADGYHELRAIAYSPGRIRHQGFDTLGFEVANRGRHVRITDLQTDHPLDSRQPFPLTVHVKGSGKPTEIAVVAQERIIARATPVGDTPTTLFIDPTKLGEGPVTLQAVAVFDGTQAIRSPPVQIRLVHQSTPPAWQYAEFTPLDEERLRITPHANDPREKPWTAAWYINALKEVTPTALERLTSIRARARPVGDGLALTSTSPTELGMLLFDLDQPGQLQRVAVDLQLPSRTERDDSPRFVGIVFNYRNPGSYSLVLLNGLVSTWVVRNIQNYESTSIESRGIPEPRGEVYTLEIEQGPSGSTKIRVNGDHIMSVDLPLATGSIGLVSASTEASFTNLRVSPPSALDASIRTERNNLVVPAGTSLPPIYVQVENTWDRSLPQPVFVPSP
ncbi:MAG TPA: hypothetical protein PKE55_05635 [Kiritimatiellia bacterium]|nr:hypothetical protein [Kiritimatiellia bacterium]